MTGPDPGDLKVIAAGLRFPEGPVALADGSVLVVEIAGPALTRVFPDGSCRVVAELEGGPNGAALGPDGWCYICNSGGWDYVEEAGLMRPVRQSDRPGWIERVKIETGAVERIHTSAGTLRLQAPNDIVFDRHAGFWFTDHGKQTGLALGTPGVFYGRADGSPLVNAIPGLITPNGIGLSPDGGTLYVSETITRNVHAFDVAAPGQIAPRPFPSFNGGRLIAGLPDDNYLDSLAVDADGHVAVASLSNGGIWDISPHGKNSVHIALPDRFTTNICFGGKQLRTAFVTLSSRGELVSFRWPRPGLAIPHSDFDA